MASQTLDDVKRAMKINYFDDKRLIAEQAEHFSSQTIGCSYAPSISTASSSA